MPDLGNGHPINPQELQSTLMERQLAAIWCRVLKLDAIDVHENFFDLGGYVLLTECCYICHSDGDGCPCDLCTASIFP
jgi:hypothetical protein